MGVGLGGVLKEKEKSIVTFLFFKTYRLLQACQTPLVAST